MASIFLSYARADVAKARTLASLLERADHSVWWDRYIKGGTQYAHEIEAALKVAEKVVVLWSAGSVDSAWVRDEAAAGRDTGRLVPVTLDGTQPPLGFGQYQTVSFANWHGRGKPRNFEELLDAISSRGGMQDGAGSPIRSVSTRPWQRPLLWLTPLLLLLGVSIYVGARTEDPRAATVAVEPATGDALAVAAARDLSIRLSSTETGNASAFHLTTSEAKDARPDLVLQVAAQSGPSSSTRDVTLLSAPSRSILWAGRFQQSSDKADDLSAQMGVTTARVLSCAVEALSERRAKLNEQTVKLYLTGCSRLAEEYDETTSDVTPLLEKAVQSAPDFAAAWARLLYSEAIAVDGLPDSPMLAPLRKHFQQARGKGIDTGASYVAEAALLPSNSYFARMDTLERGVAAHPNDPMLQAALGDWLMRVGRQNDAIAHARRASELDPASPAARMRYVWTLAHSGKPGALNELVKAERTWPGATNIELARFSYEMRYGDPRVARRMIEEGSARWGQEAVIAFSTPAFSQQRRISTVPSPRRLKCTVRSPHMFPVWSSLWGRSDEMLTRSTPFSPTSTRRRRVSTAKAGSVRPQEACGVIRGSWRRWRASACSNIGSGAANGRISASTRSFPTTARVKRPSTAARRCQPAARRTPVLALDVLSRMGPKSAEGSQDDRPA